MRVLVPYRVNVKDACRTTKSKEDIYNDKNIAYNTLLAIKHTQHS